MVNVFVEADAAREGNQGFDIGVAFGVEGLIKGEFVADSVFPRSRHYNGFGFPPNFMAGMVMEMLDAERMAHAELQPVDSWT